MSDYLLDVENLGKVYRSYSAEWKRVLHWLGLPMHSASEHWALRHVSFRIERGEAIGIVGQNGAGKSTLLKLVTGTARANEGKVTCVGRISAILELGMGFGPDLTGRENCRHAAGLMGHSEEQISRMLPEIEAFAEIGDYFDQPVRTYSSGMQMRVAFGVATAVRPDILIVDEALAVGDTYFQHKSFDRIRKFREQGTTLLIVSHDRSAVQQLCDRAILLDQGRLIKDGGVEEVMDYYNALIAERENQTVTVTRLEDGRVQTVSGTGEASVETVGLYDARGEPVEFVNVGQPVELRIRARVHRAVPRLVLGYIIRDRLGQAIYGTNTHYTRQALEDVPAGAVVDYVIRFPMNIGAGTYSVSTALVSTETHLENNYEWRDLALLFTVANLDKPFFVGTAWVEPSIELTVS
ncbi:MAG: ABC transporter ATP-binding protein [Gammaproteobacteria bacterium]|nr:ABC transporter ATP-binding protein [Gammaproteobacteria bacterium]